MVLPGGADGLVVGRLRDRLGHQLLGAVRLPRAAGVLRGRALALRADDGAALLSRRDRPLGNSILQSGASLGAIATPIVVLLLAGTAPESWRIPFRVIGALGVFWVVGWLATIRAADLELKPSDVPAPAPTMNPPRRRRLGPTRADRFSLVRRFLALAVVVIMINWCWQYFRAWMPGMLREQYG